MTDVVGHDHAFGTLESKIDPNKVVASLKKNIHAQEFKEVTIMDGDSAKDFTPMQWPLFDDGKPVSTNAMGYEIGGYFKRHQEAMRLAQIEAERKAEEERLAAEQQEAESKAQEEAKAKENTVSVEELEAIRNAARNEGYTEGMNIGHQEGYDKGLELGRTEGFEQGHQDGIEGGYQDGFRQGRDEGFAKGQEAGIASGSDMVTTQADRFRHLADMLANPLRELDETVTDEIVYLISRLTKVILKREIKGDAEWLKQSIEKAVSLLPEAKGGAEIKLAEDDYALMVAVIGREYMTQQKWNLSADSTLSEGDVVVNTKVGSVQWRLDDRIDSLLDEFLVGASEAVSSARQEVIEGAPDYDEAPKKPLAQPRDLFDMQERIERNLAEMAPGTPVMPDIDRPSTTALGSAEEFTGPDIDAAEIAAASRMDASNVAHMQATNGQGLDGMGFGADFNADAGDINQKDGFASQDLGELPKV